MHEQVRNAGLKGIQFRVYSHELWLRQGGNPFSFGMNATALATFARACLPLGIMLSNYYYS